MAIGQVADRFEEIAEEFRTATPSRVRELVNGAEITAIDPESAQRIAAFLTAAQASGYDIGRAAEALQP